MSTSTHSDSTRSEMEKKLAQIMVGPGSLTEKLAIVRSGRDHFLPAEITNIMDRAIEDLVKSGIRASALKPGDRLPVFTLPDTAGKPVDIADLLKARPLVITFYRGGWCPYCNIQLHALNLALPQIEALGASIVAISPELPDRQATTQEAQHLSFPLLHDVGSRVARKFGIVYELPADLQSVYQELGHGLGDMNGSAGATELPLPATFVAGRDGIIQLAHVEGDYTQRLDPKTIIVTLQKS
jgi:peroxiredoxin